jgi:NTP pyrophosphatase (non-canonical NTP hydrolase)
MPFNALSDAEDERLTLLSEECAEVIQVICKIQRHGYESAHPDNLIVTNRNLLQKELGHVAAAATLLSHAADIQGPEMERSMFRKLKSVQQYLHHQPKELFDSK